LLTDEPSAENGAALSRLDEIRTQGRIHGTAASARVMDSQATAAR
jgi:hypothetical protein